MQQINYQLLSSQLHYLLFEGTAEEKIKVLQDLLTIKTPVGQAHSRDFDQILREYISTAHADNHKRKDKCKKVLAPYIAAYLASLETDLTVEQFATKYGITFDDSSYSNWTSQYFHPNPDAVRESSLYDKRELKYWWKRFGLTDDNIRELLDDMQDDGLL